MLPNPKPLLDCLIPLVYRRATTLALALGLLAMAWLAEAAADADKSALHNAAQARLDKIASRYVEQGLHTHTHTRNEKIHWNVLTCTCVHAPKNTCPRVHVRLPT